MSRSEEAFYRVHAWADVLNTPWDFDSSLSFEGHMRDDREHLTGDV